MAGNDYSCSSLDDLPLLRNAFTKCLKDLIEETDFNVMYEELNNTEIGKRRMSSIFVLRAGNNDEISLLANAQELYNRISQENDENFVSWFNEIKYSLSRTGNKNRGKHQEVWEKISSILQDSQQNSMPKACKVS